MNKIAIGLLVLSIVSVSAVAIAGTRITPSNRSVYTSEKHDFNINQLKFVDAKFENINGQDVVSTKIENTSDFTITGVGYKYKINNRIVNIACDQKIEAGDTSHTINIKVNKKNVMTNANLLSANISLLNEEGQVHTVEYAKSI